MTRFDLAFGRAPRAQPPFNRGDVAVPPPEQRPSVDPVDSVVERDEVAQVRTASVGVQTMGSPRRLNEVFMTTGTPVRLPNSSISRQYKGLTARSTV